jgi:hypothetical protein
MNSLQLYQQLAYQFSRLELKLSKPQRTNLALLSQALAVSPNCHLAALALALPVPGNRENLVQRLRRLLAQTPDWQDWYGPLVQHLFAHWQGAEVALVMDRTDLADRWSLLTLGAAHGKRLLPLCWQVLPFGGTSADKQIGLLHRVRPYLPPAAHVRVTFYGDSEFRAVPVQAYCREQHWHWYVGLKSDLLFQEATGSQRALRDLSLRPGQRVYCQGVTLTEKHAFGPVNLVAQWSVNEDSPRYWATDQPADRQTWRRGRKRFWIEPTFRDWKSYGFELERSKLDDADRLQVLVLGMAVTTLWLIHLGQWVIATGRAGLLTAPHKRDYSLFRLGRDYVQRAQTMGWTFPVGFTVTHPPAAHADRAD